MRQLAEAEPPVPRQPRPTRHPRHGPQVPLQRQLANEQAALEQRVVVLPELVRRPQHCKGNRQAERAVVASFWGPSSSTRIGRYGPFVTLQSLRELQPVSGHVELGITEERLDAGSELDPGTVLACAPPAHRGGGYPCAPSAMSFALWVRPRGRLVRSVKPSNS